MFDKQLALFIVISILTAVSASCSNEPSAPTQIPLPPTPSLAVTTPAFPSPTTVLSPTVVPFQPIVLNLQKDSLFKALPQDEASCLATGLGGREKAASLIDPNYRSGFSGNSLSDEVLDATKRCISQQTVNELLVGQITLDSVALSNTTVNCIEEKTIGVPIEVILTIATTDIALDSVFVLLQSALCLNTQERENILKTDSFFAFNDFGGINAIECAANKLGPINLTDVLEALQVDDSGDVFDLSKIPEHLPLLIECHVLDDSTFESTGLSASQISCLLKENEEKTIQIMESASNGSLGIKDLVEISVAIEACELALEDLIQAVGIQVTPQPKANKPATSQVAPKATPSEPENLPAKPQPTATEPTTLQVTPEPTSEKLSEDKQPSDTATPTTSLDLESIFSDEQLECLRKELGEDTIDMLLAGGAPDITMFPVLTSCSIDVGSLLKLR